MSLSSSLKLVVATSSPVTGSIGSDVKVTTVAMVKRAHDLPQVQIHFYPIPKILQAFLVHMTLTLCIIYAHNDEPDHKKYVFNAVD